MFAAELKRKLRSLKRLERRMRFRYLSTHEQAPLVWNTYFSTSSHLNNRYSFDILLQADRMERKRIFEEYLYAVFMQHFREEGISFMAFHDPEILSFFGLSPYASLTDIKKRFRELAHLYHPDKGGDAEKMIELLDMYERCFPKKKS